MAWIEIIDDEKAEGRLKKLYDQIRDPNGHVDNILAVHSLRPATLHGHLWLYKATIHTRPNALSYRERELIGTYVSILNGCDYCVQHHRTGLGRILDNQDLAMELSLALDGKRSTEKLTARERAMGGYARKLTLSPRNMLESDLEPLRAVGMDDGEILDLNQIVAYFAYANRTVSGLGVDTTGDTLGLSPSEEDEGFRHS